MDRVPKPSDYVCIHCRHNSLESAARLGVGPGLSSPKARALTSWVQDTEDEMAEVLALTGD
jgi:hypothetical protein